MIPSRCYLSLSLIIFMVMMADVSQEKQAAGNFKCPHKKIRLTDNMKGRSKTEVTVTLAKNRCNSFKGDHNSYSKSKSWKNLKKCVKRKFDDQKLTIDVRGSTKKRITYNCSDYEKFKEENTDNIQRLAYHSDEDEDEDAVKHRFLSQVICKCEYVPWVPPPSKLKTAHIAIIVSVVGVVVLAVVIGVGHFMAKRRRAKRRARRKRHRDRKKKGRPGESTKRKPQRYRGSADKSEATATMDIVLTTVRKGPQTEVGATTKVEPTEKAGKPGGPKGGGKPGSGAAEEGADYQTFKIKVPEKPIPASQRMNWIDTEEPEAPPASKGAKEAQPAGGAPSPKDPKMCKSVRQKIEGKAAKEGKAANEYSAGYCSDDECSCSNKPPEVLEARKIAKQAKAAAPAKAPKAPVKKTAAKTATKAPPAPKALVALAPKAPPPPPPEQSQMEPSAMVAPPVVSTPKVFPKKVAKTSTPKSSPKLPPKSAAKAPKAPKSPKAITKSQTPSQSPQQPIPVEPPAVSVAEDESIARDIERQRSPPKKVPRGKGALQKRLRSPARRQSDGTVMEPSERQSGRESPRDDEDSDPAPSGAPRRPRRPPMRRDSSKSRFETSRASPPPPRPRRGPRRDSDRGRGESDRDDD